MSNRLVQRSRFYQRLVLAAAAGAVGLAAPGCGNKPAQTKGPGREDSQLAARPQAEQAETPPSNALAAKINTYTEQLAQQMAQRGQLPEQGNKGGEPSDVQFMKPGAPTTSPLASIQP